MQSSPSPSLVLLPTELLLQIYSLIDIPSRTIFPILCQRFYATFPIPPLDSFRCTIMKRDVLRFLEETCGIFHSRYALCYGLGCVPPTCDNKGTRCTRCNGVHAATSLEFAVTCPGSNTSASTSASSDNHKVKNSAETDNMCGCFYSPDIPTNLGVTPSPNIHPRAVSFTPQELTRHVHRGPRTRACLATAKSIFVSPSRQLVYTSLYTHSLRTHYRAPNPPEEAEDDGSLVRVNLEDFALRTRYAILTVPRTARVSRVDIAAVMAGFGIPACPHTRVNNERVIMAYEPCLPVVEGPRLVDLADSVDRIKCRFASCNTEMHWYVRPAEEKGVKVIYLHVSRLLGTFERATDPMFLAQCAVPNTKRLTEVWERCHRWKDEVGALIGRKYQEDTLADDPIPISQPNCDESMENEPLLWPVYGPPFSA